MVFTVSSEHPDRCSSHTHTHRGVLEQWTGAGWTGREPHRWVPTRRTHARKGLLHRCTSGQEWIQVWFLKTWSSSAQDKRSTFLLIDERFCSFVHTGEEGWESVQSWYKPVTNTLKRTERNYCGWRQRSKTLRTPDIQTPPFDSTRGNATWRTKDRLRSCWGTSRPNWRSRNRVNERAEFVSTIRSDWWKPTPLSVNVGVIAVDAVVAVVAYYLCSTFPFLCFLLFSFLFFFFFVKSYWWW